MLNSSQLGRNTLLLIMFLPLTSSTVRLSFLKLRERTWIYREVGVKGASIDMLFYHFRSYTFYLFEFSITPTLNKRSLERF